VQDTRVDSSDSAQSEEKYIFGCHGKCWSTE
jgi:hypothetical protein